MPPLNTAEDISSKRWAQTSAIAATAAIGGENPCNAAVQIETGRGQSSSSSINSGQPERKERTMSGGGLSKARLDRMHNVMAGHVAHGGVPGVVTLISRRGEVHVDAIGMKALGGNDPMRRDTIFRIASISKPITAAATMILVEECKLRLDEPVDRLLPELANRKVLERLEGRVEDTVPANRPITVRDLLTFRMGLGMIMAMPGTYPIQKAAARARALGHGPAGARVAAHTRRMAPPPGHASPRLPAGRTMDVQHGVVRPERADIRAWANHWKRFYASESSSPWA